jgi:hypothetical protein
MNSQIQITKEKPTFQKVEKALINIVKVGIYYRKPKDGNFLKNYKKKINKLRQAEDSDENILENTKRLFPSKDKYYQIIDDDKSYYGKDPKILNTVMDLYKLYYKLAKDYFIRSPD